MESDHNQRKTKGNSSDRQGSEKPNTVLTQSPPNYVIDVTTETINTFR